MAQFMAQAQGDGQETHRLGSKSSGALVRLGGWDFGVMAQAAFANDHEHISLFLTGGSNQSRQRVWVLDIEDDDTLYEIADKLSEAAHILERLDIPGWPR